MAPLTRSKRQPSKQPLVPSKRVKLSADLGEPDSDAEETARYLQTYVPNVDDEDDDSFDAESDVDEAEDEEIDRVEIAEANYGLSRAEQAEDPDLDIVAHAANSIIVNDEHAVHDDNDTTLGSQCRQLQDFLPVSGTLNTADQGDESLIAARGSGAFPLASNDKSQFSLASLADFAILDRQDPFDNGEGSSKSAAANNGDMVDNDFIDDNAFGSASVSPQIVEEELSKSAGKKRKWASAQGKQRAPAQASATLGSYNSLTPAVTPTLRDAQLQVLQQDSEDATVNTPSGSVPAQGPPLRNAFDLITTGVTPNANARARARKPPVKFKASAEPIPPAENPNNEDNSETRTIPGPKLFLPPLYKLREIIQDLVNNALKNGLQKYVDQKKQFFLTVGTVCSGTDAPLHVLNLFGMLKNANGDQVFTTINKFACEIEPFKQAFLMRNSKPNLLFRDVTEFSRPGAKRAHLVSGAEADIPDVDIFIAGTSCVDFSSLNSKKHKDFADLRDANNKWEALREMKKGKVIERLSRDDLDDEDWLNCINAMMNKTGQSRTSTTTFASAMNYVKERQPKIAIFENVQGAPWESTTRCIFPLIGYAAVVLDRLDTKDFYLPQTRQRKYVVAFSVAFFGEKAAEALCKSVKGALESLQRPYSSPVTNFLLPANSHELHRARNEMELASQTTKERDTDWGFSKGRHTQFRREQGIPQGRLWIQWEENGSSNAPAKMWKAWEARQPNRVKDLLECFYSLALSGKNPSHGVYDPAHKAQILDASQNVDRVNMGQPFGGTGCLTPNAIPFLSSEARPITGSEALKLQGMPIENFDMSIETQSQLQDLAGNAMSTTVVGAVILSALVCIANYDEKNELGWLQDELFLKRDFEVAKQDVNTFDLYDSLVDFGKCCILPDFSLSTHIPASVDTVLELGEKTRRRCECQHILGYSSMDIYLCQICGASLCKSCKGNPKHQMARSEVSFHEIGSLTYARAQDQLRQFFPSVLPMLTDSQGLADRIADTLQENLYSSEQNRAYAGAIVAGLCNTTYEMDFIEITDVTRIEYVSKGNFILRAIIEKDALTWYLHLDKWSRTARQMGIRHKTAQPIAKAVLKRGANYQFPIPDSWEIWYPYEVEFPLLFELEDDSDEQVLRLRTALPFDDPGFLDVDGPYGLEAIMDDNAARAIAVLNDTKWILHPECGMPERAFWVCTDADALEYHDKLFMYMDVNPIGPSVDDRFVISPICREMGRAPEPETRPVLLRIDAEYRLHIMLRESQSFRVKASIKGWWTNLKDHQIEMPAFSNDADVFRGRNFPYKPPVSLRMPSNDTEIAVHGPSSTCDRDQVLLSMSLPIFGQSEDAIQKLIQTMRDFDLSQQLDLAEFAYLIGPCYTAVERAIIDLARGNRSIQLWDVVLAKDCETCAPKLPGMVFEKSVQRGAKSISATYAEQDEIAYTQSLIDQPTSFRIDHNVLLDVPHADKNPDVHYVDIRFVGRAHTLMQQARSHLSAHPRYHGDGLQTRATFSIGFGILEDPRLALAAVKILPPPAAENLQPAGFRPEIKLLTEQLGSLQWMLSRENDDVQIAFIEKESAEVYIEHLRLRVYAEASRNIIRRGRILADDVGFGKTAVCLGLIDRQRDIDLASRSKRQQDPALRDLIHLKATLVIVPNHLTQQWKSEADRFFKQGLYTILVIETYASFLNQSRNFDRADIIICSNQVFKNVAYRKELVKLHDSYGVNIDTFPRVYRNWYRNVLTNLAPVGNLNARASLKLLEYFTFARVIWDEFPYENTEVSEFVANCVTQSKWMLSGTPPLASLGQVCKIAYLFNVHLARPLSLVAGRQPKVCENEALEPLSQLEEAQLYQSRASPGFLQERHDQLLRFVHKFFSKNQRELTVQSSQLPVVLTMSSNSRTAYMDLQQDLSGRSYNANLVGSESRRRLMGRVDWTTKALGVVRSVEALVLRASLSFADVKECMKFDDGDDQSSLEVIASAMYKNSVQTITGLEERGRELFGKACYLAFRVAHVNVRNHVHNQDNGEDRQFSYYKTLQNFKDGILAVDFADTYRGWDAFESGMRILFWDEQFEQELGTERMPSWEEKSAWEAILQSLWDKMSFGVVRGDNPVPTVAPSKREMLQKKLAALNLFREYVTKTPLHSRRWFSVENMSAADFASIPHLLKMEWDSKIPWEAEYRSKNGGDMSTLVPLRELRRPNGNNPQPFSLQSFRNAQAEDTQRMNDMDIIPQAEINRVTLEMQIRLGVRRITKAHWTDECARQGLKCKSTERVEDVQNRVVLAAMGKASEEHWITPQGCALKFAHLLREGKLSIRGGQMEPLFDELMHTVDNLTLVIGRLAPAHGKKNCLKVIYEVLAGKWECDAHQGHDAIDTHYVSLSCGHVHCAKPDHDDVCGVRGCTAPLAGACVPLSKFKEKPRVINHTDFAKGALVKRPAPYLTSGDEGQGQKLNAIIGLIDSMADEDQVVVFVQNSELLKDTYAALTQAGITHVTDRELQNNESQAVESFKNSSAQANRLKKKKCLVQLINSEQAAGSNLHNANHVVFVSPLITRNQAQWDAQMQQALGRCIRFRQQKLVHVYHMVMADTIEVDILEWRQKQEVLVRAGASVGRFAERDVAGFLERMDDAPLPRTSSSAEAGGEERVVSMLPRGEIQALMGDDYVSVTMARSKNTVESANAAVLEEARAEAAAAVGGGGDGGMESVGQEKAGFQAWTEDVQMCSSSD